MRIHEKLIKSIANYVELHKFISHTSCHSGIYALIAEKFHIKI